MVRSRVLTPPRLRLCLRPGKRPSFAREEVDLSQQDLQSFQQTVNSKPEVKQKLQSTKNKSEFISEAVRLGKEHGYNFTDSEVQEFLDSSASPTRSLSDQQLQSGVGRPESYTYSKPGCQHH